MRPVNLIPAEDRRDGATARTGVTAYLLIGAMVLILGAVTMVVLTDKKISDRKEKVAILKQQESETKTQAQQFASFTQFGSLEKSRTATVQSLADSRFDWPRVMRELARVIPGDVWLTNLTGAVSSDASASVSSGSSAPSAASGSIAGPSLSLTGCAAGQESVARFLGALRDIDGVTRVGLSSSDLPDSTTTSSSATSGDSASGSGSTDCQVRDFIAQFQIVVAFDNVPAPPVAGAAPSTTTSTAAPTDSGSTSTTPASDTSSTPGT